MAEALKQGIISGEAEWTLPTFTTIFTGSDAAPLHECQLGPFPGPPVQVF